MVCVKTLLGLVPPKFNSSPLKNGGWKTSLSYWVSVTFQGRTVKLQVGSTHTIHGTGIFTYIWLIFMVHVGKYTIHLVDNILSRWFNSWPFHPQTLGWSRLQPFQKVIQQSRKRSQSQNCQVGLWVFTIDPKGFLVGFLTILGCRRPQNGCGSKIGEMVKSLPSVLTKKTKMFPKPAEHRKLHQSGVSSCFMGSHQSFAIPFETQLLWMMKKNDPKSVVLLWVVATQIFLEFSPRKLGKIPILTNIFQPGWNHQLVLIFERFFGIIFHPWFFAGKDLKIWLSGMFDSHRFWGDSKTPSMNN